MILLLIKERKQLLHSRSLHRQQKNKQRTICTLYKDRAQKSFQLENLGGDQLVSKQKSCGKDYNFLQSHQEDKASPSLRKI